MAAEKKRLAHWFSGKPRAKPLEGRRQRAVSRGQEAPQRAGMGILAAGPLTLAVVLANAGAPFAAPNQCPRFQSRERSGAPAPRERAVPARIHPPWERPAPPQHRLPRQGRKLETLGHEPLTPAGILPNSDTQVRGSCLISRQPLTLAVVLANAGAPFAAPNAQSIRLQRRESERSLRGSIRRGNERPHRSTAAEQGIANARRRTAHSGRRSGERRHPVRGSERAINPPSEPRAKRRASAAGASGPCANPSAAGTTGPTAAPVASAGQEIGNARARTAHSGRNSAEFRRPVRGSEPMRALSEPRAKRRASAARASGPCADPSAAREAGRAGD